MFTREKEKNVKSREFTGGVLLRIYFHDVQVQLKTGIHTNFCSEWALGFVTDYA